MHRGNQRPQMTKWKNWGTQWGRFSGLGAANVAGHRSRRCLLHCFITFVNQLKEVKFYCLHVCWLASDPCWQKRSSQEKILVPTPSTIRCLTFSCDWHLISSCTAWIQQQKVEKKPFSHCPITARCPQTNRKPYRATMSGQEFLSPHLNCVWHVQMQSCATSTLPALSPSIHVTRGAQLPWCRFHLSQANRGDTMRAYSENLIKPSCPV